MDHSIIEQMPFPYFIINGEYQILFSSKSANQKFSVPSTFVEIVHSSQWTNLRDYIHDKVQSSFIELNMLVNQNKMESFQVYKLIPSDGTTHLICIPSESSSPEVNQLLDSVEKKISNLNIELETNKYNFDQRVSEIKDAAILSEHLATIGQLAAGIAHEIRNPLTTVKGFIQLLQPYLVDIGKEEYAIIALEEIERANEIIFEFLNAAKPQQNKKQIINVQKLVKDIVMLYESEAILRNIEIDTTLDDDQAKLCIDIKQMKQVLVNLVKNAIEAIGENPNATKGKISIKTENMNGYAIILIEDNGIGMKKETIDKLFVPFFSTKSEGTGIGLTVCKKIIEEHGGNIDVASTPLLGTSFRIRLPIYQNMD
jgi:signal transduction histidine kinase